METQNDHQRLVCIDASSTSDKRELQTLITVEGWNIKQISACGTNLSNFCWVLLEK